MGLFGRKKNKNKNTPVTSENNNSVTNCVSAVAEHSDAGEMVELMTDNEHERAIEVETSRQPIIEMEPLMSLSSYLKEIDDRMAKLRNETNPEDVYKHHEMSANLAKEASLFIESKKRAGTPLTIKEQGLIGAKVAEQSYLNTIHIKRPSPPPLESSLDNSSPSADLDKEQRNALTTFIVSLLMFTVVVAVLAIAYRIIDLACSLISHLIFDSSPYATVVSSTLGLILLLAIFIAVSQFKGFRWLRLLMEINKETNLQQSN